MSINRRITGGKRLRHHKLFGSIENPPLGWRGDERGFSFSLKDYEAEVAAKIKAGMKPAQAHREIGRSHGPQAWNWLDTFFCKTVLVPPEIAKTIPHPMTDREYRFHPKHNRFIAGWWYDRFASGIGPTNTIAGWVATRVGYISEGQPHVHRAFDKTSIDDLERGIRGTTYHDTIFFVEPARCIAINPYTDYQYLGEFTRPIKEYPEYVEHVEAAILKKFLRLHKIGASK